MNNGLLRGGHPTRYVSGLIPIPATTAPTLTLGHGLNSGNVQTLLVLVCLTPELGFTAGEEVPAYAFFTSNALNDQPAFTVGANGANVVITLNVNSHVNVVSRLNGVTANMTYANWALKAYAWIFGIS